MYQPKLSKSSLCNAINQLQIALMQPTKKGTAGLSSAEYMINQSTMNGIEYAMLLLRKIDESNIIRED